MSRVFLQVGSVVSIIVVAMFLLTRSPQIQQSNDANRASAAYRDGWQLGNRAALGGNKPHVLLGRWSSESDRGLFAAGYFQGYIKDGIAVAPVAWKPEAADQKGFDDGKAAGADDRQHARPFAVTNRHEYRKVRSAYRMIGNADNTRSQYLQGFAVGYQHAYYEVEAQAERPIEKVDRTAS
jgi:hypothetical protein